MDVDGTGNPWIRADIGINAGKIEKISRRPLEAATTIDATKLMVCPSFIDLHSHSDYSILHFNKAESSPNSSGSITCIMLRYEDTPDSVRCRFCIRFQQDINKINGLLTTDH